MSKKYRKMGENFQKMSRKSSRNTETSMKIDQKYKKKVIFYRKLIRNHENTYVENK